MKKEDIVKANFLLESIKTGEKYLKYSDWMLNETVNTRASWLTFADYEILIPESLFRKIGALINAEYTFSLHELRTELHKL